MHSAVNFSKVGRIKDHTGPKTMKRRAKEVKGIFGGLEGTEEINPYKHGTNPYLEEIGIVNGIRTDAVLGYKEGVLKDAARIAYDRGQRKGLDNNQVREEFLYLIQAVDSLGERAVRDLVIRRGMDPIKLLTDFKITEIDGFNYITPQRAKVPLELLVDDVSVAAQLKPKGLETIYLGENAMMFDYIKH